MIYGIGVDLVRIKRMEILLSKYGDRLARRILTDEELTGYLDSKMKAKYLAKRYAAKEAVVKAMGTGFRFGISLKHIGISNDELGRPSVKFLEKAEEICTNRGITSSHVSISDEKKYAVAYAVLESS